MKLTRYGSIPGIGTFGLLDYGIAKFYTVEKPWLDNKPFESCVPAGMYEMVPHASEKYGDTFAIVGETVSQYKSAFERYACLFHAANWPKDVQGCIGLGSKLGYINGMLGVSNSRNSVAEFQIYMAKNYEREVLIIQWENINTIE